MKQIIYRIMLIVPLLLTAAQVSAQDQQMQWRAGEELIFKVRWSFVRLGTLKIQIADSSNVDGEDVFQIKLNIDSNPLLFFVNRHYVYSCSFTKSFKVQELTYFDDEEGVRMKSVYSFDHKNKNVHLTRTDTTGKTEEIVKDVSYKGELYDGVSLIYYARNTVNRMRIDTLQYIADDGYAKMIIDFKGEDKSLKIKAFKKKIPSARIEGFVYDKGIAGLSGKFKGWFSRDSRRLPLKAKLKVFIGSVIVELEEINYK